MEIHLGFLPYPKENDTFEEVSLYLLSFYHFVANKSFQIGQIDIILVVK
jgi:hypothetical protein